MPTLDERLAKASQPADEAMRLHPFYHGKVQMMAKCPVRALSDFSVWYTPGVAAPCRAIHTDRELVYEHTNKANCIAIVSDGTRVLGLGDIGPEAALPVMEGKALIFKHLGGVDAVPLCLRTKDPEAIIEIVKALEPSFGAINLEDISQPKCFYILDRLRAEMEIPVWHDDQQGSATVLLAGLLNALRVVGKSLGNVRIAMIGVGAANVATYRLLAASGADLRRIVACDRRGTLHIDRRDIEERQAEYRDKWRICTETNSECVTGGIPEALQNADVCIAFSASGPNVIRPEWVKAMAPDAIVFACANPIPEIWPWEAAEAGARIVGTGRSDFPNQVNNSLGFPAIFRGALDVRARTITDGMAIAAALELAQAASEKGLSNQRILPSMDEWEVYPRVATATAMKAQLEGIARYARTADQLYNEARATILRARDASRVLLEAGIIPPIPEPAGHC